MRNLLLLVRKDFTSASMIYGSAVVMWVIYAVCVAMLVLVPVGAMMIFLIMTYIMVLGLFQNEENELVCNVIGILPVRKRDAVIARYLYLYGLLGALSLVACIASPLASTWHGDSYPWGTSLLLALSGTLLMSSILMPLNYLFGSMKMRFASMIVYVGMVMLTSGSIPFFARMQESKIALPLDGMMAGVFAGCVLLSFVSMAISVRVKR